MARCKGQSFRRVILHWRLMIEERTTSRYSTPSWHAGAAPGGDRNPAGRGLVVLSSVRKNRCFSILWAPMFRTHLRTAAWLPSALCIGLLMALPVHQPHARTLRVSKVHGLQRIGVHYRPATRAFRMEKRVPGGHDREQQHADGVPAPGGWVGVRFEETFTQQFGISLEQVQSSQIVFFSGGSAPDYQATAVRLKLNALIVVTVTPLVDNEEGEWSGLRVAVKMRRTEDGKVLWNASARGRRGRRADTSGAGLDQVVVLRHLEQMAHDAVRRLFGGRSLGAASVLAGTSVAALNVAPTCLQIADQSEFLCTQIIGFSQTMNWFGTPRTAYFENDPSIDGDRWQLLWRGGAAVEDWANPEFEGYLPEVSGTNLLSPCAQGSAEPDRILLTVSTNLGVADSSPQEVSDYILKALETLRGKYPTVRSFILQPVVGGPEDCAVRAVENHPRMIEAIRQVTAEGFAIAGMAAKSASCDDFKDAKGHLKSKARPWVAQQLATCYGSRR